MERTYADLRPGARLNIDVEFIRKQTVECAGTTVTRLVVADQAGEQFTVLVMPEYESVPELATGAMYRISGLLGARPVDSVPDSSEECPDCGGQLRVGQVVDTIGSGVTAAVSKLGVDEPFGIVDATAGLQATVDDADVVDDWTPMHEERSVEPPDFVCDACGRHIDDGELRHQGGVHHEINASAAPAASADMASPETVGLAVGGVQDVTNFRENVAEGFTPQPEAISDEGLFYEYYFETGERTATDALFAPRYATAVSAHPRTGDVERYLSVGLDSTLSVGEFERPRLDLVAVLDVSGSMDSPFDEYYYDKQGHKRAAETAGETKLSAAIQSLCALTEQLHAEDRLGVVLYNHRAHVAKPLRDVGATDMPAIRRHIREIKAGGGTNLADGFEAAIDMLIDGPAGRRVERRVMFLTDMMPNTGATGETELTDLFADAAADGIHTTFIGMGVDANAELADALSGIRGANHYFVHSADEFEQRLGTEFDYMVTPLVYNLTLELDAEGYEIEAVHGSPSADATRDRLMHVGTLFPSATQDGESRGGVVLVRLAQQRPDTDLELVASWTERDGTDQTERVTVSMPESPETFAHDGVRKAVALARYARALRAWAREIHERAAKATGVDDWVLADQRGHQERESVQLVVPDEYADRFTRLRDYLATESAAVADDSINQELELLDTLSQAAATSPEVSK
jgi:Ca-activated chloride channel family protein